MGRRNLMRCCEPAAVAGNQAPPAIPPAAAHTSVRRGSAGPPVPAVLAHKVRESGTPAAGTHCQDSAAVHTRQVAQVAWNMEQVLSLHLAGTRVAGSDYARKYCAQLRQLLGVVGQQQLPEAAEGWRHNCLLVQVVDLVVAPKQCWY